MSSRPIQIDSDGYLMSSGLRLNDPEFGAEVLSHIFTENRIYYTKAKGITFPILAFDAPLVARQVQLLEDGKCDLLMPYGHHEVVATESLLTDEWDRFFALNERQIPIVFSRAAQAELFRVADEFDDDSITLHGRRVAVKSLLPAAQDVSQSSFWSERYQNWQKTGEKPGWDLQGPHPALPEILQQIKLPKSRIAVLGAGASHDAYYLAQSGHIVTAFDISHDAIEKAKSLYPETQNLKYVLADALRLPAHHSGQFDLVFEHTFFCAINPEHRAQAIRSYRQLLVEGGHLLGLFFTITTGDRPPFGATEWEIRERLVRNFELLYWSRPQKNPPGREHWELVVYAKKLN